MQDLYIPNKRSEKGVIGIRARVPPIEARVSIISSYFIGQLTVSHDSSGETLIKLSSD